MRTAEQKALEAYPSTDRDPNGIFVQVRREDYIKGYDQAMQDFLEKACEWLLDQEEMIGISFQEDFIERFKQYMQDESEN